MVCFFQGGGGGWVGGGWCSVEITTMRGGVTNISVKNGLNEWSVTFSDNFWKVIMKLGSLALTFLGGSGGNGPEQKSSKTPHETLYFS